MSILRSLLAGSLLLLFSAQASAEGLLQLSFAGEIERPGGARVELSVDAHSGDQVRRVTLVPHLARGTGAGELAALLTDRLQDAGIAVRPEAPARADGLRAHVFVERAVAVRVRTGHGLTMSVTICEGIPASVAVLPPRASLSTARLIVSGSTVHAHTDARDLRTFEVELDPAQHSAYFSEVLFRSSIENQWIAERPGSSAWRPVRMADGSRITGVGLDLDTAGDWRLEVMLAKRRE